MVKDAALGPKRRLTDKILKAIEEELESRRSSINDANGIRSVSIVVKVRQDTGDPRAVILQVESEKTIG